MNNIECEKKINEDFISVVKTTDVGLKYTEVEIEKKNRPLITKIEELLKKDDVSLLEIQDVFSKVYSGKPYAYSYCLPYIYSATFIDKAKYPKLYTEDEYFDELNKIRNDYVNSKIKELDDKKKNEQINDVSYKEMLDKIKDEAEVLVQDTISSMKNVFLRDSIRYINAAEFKATIDNIKEDDHNIMYSTEDIGWTKFNYQVNDNIEIRVKTNFCYGRSAYFHITLVYKDVEILSYPTIINYYYANMLDFIECTCSYKTERDNWQNALSFVVKESNWAMSDEKAFVEKWIIEGTRELINGLVNILKSPETVLNHFIENKDDESIFAVRNISDEEITEYKVFRDEMTIAFQAEKISGALLLIPNLNKLSVFYPKINAIIEQIEAINRVFFPSLDRKIEKLSDKIKELSVYLEIIEEKYRDFKRTHYKEFCDFRIYNKQHINHQDTFEEYIKLHPEFKVIKEEDDKYKDQIENKNNEKKRLDRFHLNLSRCAQMICDYGLSSIINNNKYLSTGIYLKDEKLSVLYDELIMSRDKRRLFRLRQYSQEKTIVIPSQVKVICENAFSSHSSIVSIHLPGQLRKIGCCVFQNCFNLQEIVIPDSVIEMGSDNFYNCRALKKVVLSSSLKEIPNYSFNKCVSLTTINVPESVIKIGKGAFCDCTSIQTITLPNSIQEVGDDIFKGCTNLRKIFISSQARTRFEKILWQYKNKLVVR